MMEDDLGWSSPGEKIDKWQKGEVIGKGAFGSVCIGLNLDNGKLFAVKEIETMDESPAGKEELKALENEISTLQRLRHRNIVRYLGCSRSERGLSIFLEYVSGGSICGLLERFGALQEQVVQVYTRQILLGLEYLHQEGIAHRDIKGANVLVTQDGVVKLADFGASKRIWGSSSARSVRLPTPSEVAGMSFGIKGTAMWMAPEVIREDQSNTVWKKADIWSVGCTVIEMLTGKAPWSKFSNPITAMYHIACGQNIPDIPEHLSSNGKEFLLSCFRHIPQERPDVTAILLHPFVATSRLARRTPAISPTMMRKASTSTTACPATPSRPWRRDASFNSAPVSSFTVLVSDPFKRKNNQTKKVKKVSKRDPSPRRGGAGKEIASARKGGAGSLPALPTLKLKVLKQPVSNQNGDIHHSGEKENGTVSNGPLAAYQHPSAPIRVISDPFEMVRDACQIMSLPKQPAFPEWNDELQPLPLSGSDASTNSAFANSFAEDDSDSDSDHQQASDDEQEVFSPLQDPDDTAEREAASQDLHTKPSFSRSPWKASKPSRKPRHAPILPMFEPSSLFKGPSPSQSHRKPTLVNNNNNNDEGATCINQDPNRIRSGPLFFPKRSDSESHTSPIGKTHVRDARFKAHAQHRKSFKSLSPAAKDTSQVPTPSSSQIKNKPAGTILRRDRVQTISLTTNRRKKA